eukprot:6212898-Pleurochrysis_carterae.AAC.9
MAWEASKEVLSTWKSIQAIGSAKRTDSSFRRPAVLRHADRLRSSDRSKCKPRPTQGVLVV